MKSLADGEKTVVAIPVIVVPVEVEVALVIVLVEAGDVAVAIRVHPDGAAKTREMSSESPPLVRHSPTGEGELGAEFILGAFTPPASRAK